MKMDSTRYALIYQTSHHFCWVYGLDKSNAADITQNVCLAILETLKNDKKCSHIKNWDHYIKGVVVNMIFQELRNKKKYFSMQEDAIHIFDKYDEADTDIIRGQAIHACAFIDDYLQRNPDVLPDRCQQLWDLFKEGITETKTVMAAMKIKNDNTYYSIKKRLVDRIITIYNSLGLPG